MKELMDLLRHNEREHVYHVYGEDHRDALKKIDKANEFFSVILIQEPVDDSMMENPKYVRKIPVTHTSRIEQEARSLMDSDYHVNYDWINKEIEKHYPELEDKDKYKEFDYYIKCLMDSHYPQALEECLWEWAMFQWNGDPDTEFDEEQYQEVIGKHKAEFEKYKKDVFLPQYLYEYEPIYENYIPSPLCDYAGRSIQSQLYIIKEDEKVSVAVGCSSGSGTRETHGFYGHLFAEIQKKIKPIKTFVTAVDNKCNFEVKTKSKNLILLRHDLTGNYKIDREESEKILKGIEMF
jgi:hypothetical protein